MSDPATAMLLISAVSAVAGAGLQVAGASQRAKALENQSVFDDIQARQEELKGKAEANDLRRALNTELASQSSRFGASGLSLGSGTSINAAREAVRETAFNVGISQTNTRITAATRREQARQRRGQASGERFSGLLGAATSVGSSALQAKSAGVF